MAPDPRPASTPKAGWAVSGAWVSPSCGARTYTRRIDLAIDETFQSTDLVSPCPPNVVCVWSGVVNRKGTFVVGKGTIELTVKDDGGGAGMGQPLPRSLGLDPNTHTPFETDSNGKACPYTLAPDKP